MRVGFAGLVVAGVAFATPANTRAQDTRSEVHFPLDAFGARVDAVGSAVVARSALEFVPGNPAALRGSQGVFAARGSSAAGYVDLMFAGGADLRFGSIGVSARRRGWGDIAADLGVSNLTSSEESIGLTYATPRAYGVVGGVTVKQLRADYLGHVMSSTALDAGFNVLVNRHMMVGGALLHLGSGLGGESDKSPLPSKFRFGLATSFQVQVVDLKLSTDALKPLRDGDRWDAYAGMEGRVALTNAVAVFFRGGVSELRTARSGHIGAGLAISNLHLDVSHGFGNPLGDRPIISVGLAW